MSFPAAVFLDTSILAGQQYNFNSTLLSSFKNLARNHCLKLLLPDPTNDEVERHLRDRSKLTSDLLNKAMRTGPFLQEVEPLYRLISDSKLHDMMGYKAIDYWMGFLRSLHCVNLDYTGIDLAKIMRMYNEGIAPFGNGKKRKEFPDAFAVEIVDIYAKTNNVVVAVVSADEDIIKACSRSHSLLPFRSLDLLSELLLTSEHNFQDIRNRVLQEVPALEHELLGYTCRLARVFGQDRYRLQSMRLYGSSIEEDSVRIVAIGDGECTVSYCARLEVEYILETDEDDRDLMKIGDIEDCEFDIVRISGIAKLRLPNKANDKIEVVLAEVGLIDGTNKQIVDWWF